MAYIYFMGRGQGSSSSGVVSRRSGAVQKSWTVAELIAADAAFASTGEVVVLGDGTYKLNPGDPAAGISGLAHVQSVQFLKESLRRVTFDNGSQALVDLETLQVAHEGADISLAESLGALYAAMGHEAMYATDTSVPSSDDSMAALGDAYASVAEAEGSVQGEALASLALAAHASLEARGQNVILHSEDLRADTEPQELPSVRQAQRQAMTVWRNKIRSIMQRAERNGENARLRAAQALLGDVGPDGRLLVAGETILSEAQRAAEELGCEIPQVLIDYDPDTGESIGDFEVGAAEKERIDIFRNALAVGDRAFAFRGPPGSGKGEMCRQMAALLQRPWVPINVGPSSDLEQNIGGDGLRAQVQEIEEIVLDSATGKPIIDADTGKPMTVTRKQVVTVSEMLVGPLTEAVTRPCVVEIMEPEGMEQEAIRLHSALGEKFGQPGERYLNINSSAAGKKIKIPVHPDCIIIFTYNPGTEDIKLKQATHDRCVNIDFDYPTTEAETRRLTRMVNRILMDSSNAIPDGSEEDMVSGATGIREALQPEALEPFVKVGEKLRNAARQNPGFIEAPGARTIARLVVQMMCNAYGGDVRAERTAFLLLDYLRSYDEKETTASSITLSTILGDEIKALQEFCNVWYEKGRRDRGQDVANKKPSSRTSANKKPSSRTSANKS